VGNRHKLCVGTLLVDDILSRLCLYVGLTDPRVGVTPDLRVSGCSEDPLSKNAAPLEKLGLRSHDSELPSTKASSVHRKSKLRRGMQEDQIVGHTKPFVNPFGVLIAFIESATCHEAVMQRERGQRTVPQGADAAYFFSEEERGVKPREEFHPIMRQQSVNQQWALRGGEAVRWGGAVCAPG